MAANEGRDTRWKLLMTGLGFGESPRWHEGRLWLCNWGMQQIVALDEAGRSEVIAHTPTSIPCSIDWLPDGSLLAVSGQEGKLLRLEPDGGWTVHADLNALAAGVWNEIVVDGQGNAYVNGPGIARVAPDGLLHYFDEKLAFPNGMAVTRDNSTLIVAESHGKRLTAFTTDEFGGLSGRRVWAELGEAAPDGICVDNEDAVWYADVPNKRCVRVREGGEVLESIAMDRGCFACMLGGAERTTLFVAAAEWLGFARMAEALEAKSGVVAAARVSVPGAGWPKATT